MSYEPSQEYFESDVYRQDVANELKAKKRLERRKGRALNTVVTLTAASMLVGMAYDALSDTTRYENGLECSGEVDFVVSGGEKLSDIAVRDTARLGLNTESANKLLTMYLRENTPFVFTYDEANTMFIRQDITTITSAETCTD